MAIKKKLIHFNKFATFNSKKLSANESNDKYTLGISNVLHDGSPDILYLSIVYIKDTKQLWTHGQLYDSNANVGYITNNFVDKSTNLSISGIKTFTDHINLNNKSIIRSNIDAGELKVTKTNTDQGFIVRVDTDSQDSILPLEILTTNGSASYQYNFPKTSGNVALGVKKAGLILEADLNDGLIDLGDNYLRVTYSNLRNLRDNGNLIPGLKYRITDYRATIQGLSGISVANHSFDIIVEALTQNTLSENAKAAKSDNTLGTKQQDLFNWDMNPGNWTKTTNAEIQLLTDATIYYQQGTRDVNLAGVIKVTFTPIVEDPETNDICIGADLVKNGSVVSKDYHIGRINYDPYQADDNVYYLPVSGPGSYVIRYYVAGSSSNFETNLRITAEAYNGVGYFSTCNLNAWDIKYCLDCDTNRFQWVSINPFETKGVIYYMKDDHGNEAPYDFKNILFNGYYTFSYIQSTDNILDASVALNTCYLNVIKECYSTSNVLKLNNIVFKITNSSSVCGFNYFEGNCEAIEFGDNCSSNKFGSYCKRNKFGNSCSYNSFDDYCEDNRFYNYCLSISFGTNCKGNALGSYILRVSFGKQCIYNKFTNSAAGNDSLLEACRMIKLGDQCNNINLYTTLETSYNNRNWLLNIEIGNELSGNIPITVTNNPNVIIIAKNSLNELVLYCPADRIPGPQGNRGFRGEKGIQGPQGNQGALGNQGLKGDRGLKGDKGDKGDQGPQGNRGFKGDPGPRGDLGLKGDLGIQGPKGDQGNRGLTGPRGDLGAKGDKGDQGPRGDIGPRGNTGPKGDLGNRGLTGDRGPKGDQGAKGDLGPKGDRGLTGATGPKGDLGNRGLTGATGPKGDQGAKGDTGAQGPRGATGATGATGPKGDLGATGAVGPRGATGATGATGPTGPQGNRGDQGPKGDLGVKGDRGLKGDRGPKGDQGATGAVGPQGPRGFSGGTGPTGPTGPQGNRGLQGPKGDLGPKGDKGDLGPLGNRGFSGGTGPTGPTGPQGSQGNRGYTGPQGVGISSIVRTSGTGAVGTTDIYTITLSNGGRSTFAVTHGVKGDLGAKGSKGDRGPQGNRGNLGPQGNQGAQGAQGAKGTINGYNVKVVSALPSVPNANTIYFVKES